MSQLAAIVKSVIRALATVVVTMVLIVFAAIAEILAFCVFVPRTAKADTLGQLFTWMGVFLGIQLIAYFAVRWLVSDDGATQSARPDDAGPSHDKTDWPRQWWQRNR